MIRPLRAFATLIRHACFAKTKKIETTKSVENTPPVQKDKIIFQPNMVHAHNSMEYRTQDQPKSEQKLLSDGNLIPSPFITVECSQSSINLLDNLCRFFEISQEDAIARAMWLLTLARDVEVNNKKIGIISTDETGLVIDVIPVNVV